MNEEKKTSVKKLFESVQKIVNMTMKLREKLSQEKIVGEAGAGLVKIEMNGNEEVINVHIDTQIIAKKNKRLIETLVKGAVNDAIKKVRSLVANMQKESAFNLFESLKNIMNEPKEE